MNVFWLFLLIFFSIFGALQVLSLAYTFIIRRIIIKKVDFVKIWTKPLKPSQE
jgi:hypothetical protein